MTPKPADSIDERAARPRYATVPLALVGLAALLYFSAPYLPDWEYVSPDPGHDVAFGVFLSDLAVDVAILLLILAFLTCLPWAWRRFRTWHVD